MLLNSASSWGWLSRSLHWLMAALILGQVLLGRYAHALPSSPDKLNAMMWHKSLGITLLTLAVIRLGWAISDRRPDAIPGVSAWARTSARVNHVSLYILMLAIPLSGWLMNSAKNIPFSLFRTVPWPSLIGPDESLGKLFQQWHEGLVTAFLVLLCIHVSAAMWHHFYRHDAVLLRMLGRRGSP